MRYISIPPCPEKWKEYWKDYIPENAWYFYVDGYGYVCLEFENTIMSTVYHGMPDRGKIDLEVAREFTDTLMNIISMLGYKYMFCYYKEQPKDSVVRFITKYLGFKKVDDLLYGRSE